MQPNGGVDSNVQVYYNISYNYNKDSKRSRAPSDVIDNDMEGPTNNDYRQPFYNNEIAMTDPNHNTSRQMYNNQNLSYIPNE